MKTRALLLSLPWPVLLLCLTGCAGDDAQTPGNQTPDNPPAGGTADGPRRDSPAEGSAEAGGEAAIRWQGPPVRAVAKDGGVEVTVTAPTLGYSLQLQEVTVQGQVAQADFELRTPAPDAMVGQAITELRASVPAERLPADVRKVHVRIATWQEGVQYVTAPEHVLAAVVDR